MDCNLFSGNCYIKSCTLLNLIPNHKLLITLFLQSLSLTINTCLASLRHLRQLDTKCYHSNKLRVWEPYCCCKTQFNSVNEVYVLLCARHVLCVLYTKEQRNCGGETDSVCTRWSLNWAWRYKIRRVIHLTERQKKHVT